MNSITPKIVLTARFTCGNCREQEDIGFEVSFGIYNRDVRASVPDPPVGWQHIIETHHNCGMTNYTRHDDVYLCEKCVRKEAL